MRTPALIALVAVAAIAVAWLWLTRAPQMPVAATPVATMPAPAAPATPIQNDRDVAAVRAQTTIPPPEPPSVATKEPPAPVSIATQKPAEPAAPDATPNDDADATADDESAEETEPADDGSDASTFDAHRAADLMADWMAKQDLAASDQSATPVPSSFDLKTFDQEETDADWAANAQQQIEATLNQWLDALPDGAADNLDVIHVECRQTLCQVLTAESSVVAEGHAPYEPLWNEGIQTLAQQSWFHELGFADMTSMVDHSSDYFLYQVYLKREPKSPTP